MGCLLGVCGGAVLAVGVVCGADLTAVTVGGGSVGLGYLGGILFGFCGMVGCCVCLADAGCGCGCGCGVVG